MPWEAGRLGMPYLRLYNIACVLRYEIDWIKGESGYSNRALEKSLNEKVVECNFTFGLI